MITLAPARRVLAVLALVAGAAVASHALAQDAARSPAPSPEAERVARLAGQWDLETVFAGGAPEKGTSTCRLMAGGWLIEDVHSQFQGQAFEGHGVFGWDASRGRYASIWVDNLDPRLSQHVSTWDEAKQSFIADYEELDMGAGPQRMRGVTKIEGPDAFTFTLTPEKADGKPMLTIKYTRKK